MNRESFQFRASNPELPKNHLINQMPAPKFPKETQTGNFLAEPGNYTAYNRNIRKAAVDRSRPASEEPVLA